jgi:Flp pilus assembly protein TadB
MVNLPAVLIILVISGLLIIGVLYGILDPNLTDALTIIVVVAILVIVEVWNEYRAKTLNSRLKETGVSHYNCA